MRRLWRWTKRIVLGVLALAVLAIAVAIGLLHTDWGRDRVRREVVAQLQADFPGTTIRKIEGSPFGDLILHDVTLGARDKQPLVKVKKLVVDASLRPLIDSTVYVDRIEASGVEVFVRPLPPEPPKPPRPPGPPSKPSSWVVSLPNIEVRDVKVHYENETIEIGAIRAGLALRGDVLKANAWVKGTWRAQPFDVAAVVEQGKTTKVPVALVNLGSAAVAAVGVEIADPLALRGAVDVRAPADLVKTLTEVELPGDARVSLRSDDQIEVFANAGTARVHALAHADLDKLSGSALVTAHVPELAAVTDGLEGEGTVVAAIVGDQKHARGMVSVVGAASEYAGTTLMAFDTTFERASIVNVSRARARARARLRAREEESVALYADVEQRGDAWHLTRSEVIAQAIDPAETRGRFDARVSATGQLWPETSIRASGTVDAKQIRQGSVVIPSASLALRADVAPDGTIAVDLDRHRVRTIDRRTWAGTGGHITITDDAFAVSDLRTGTSGSRITASAKVSRTSDDLEAAADVQNVSLAMLDPTIRGTASGNVQIARRGGRYFGGGKLAARQVVLPMMDRSRRTPASGIDRPAVDADVTLEVANRKVSVDGTATSTELGRATVSVAVTGPRDITDAAAWQRLERKAIDKASVALAGFDTRPLGGTVTVDGELTLSATSAGGELVARGIETRAGPVDVTLGLAPGDGATIAAHAHAGLTGIPPATADAVIALPTRPFDPRAWKRLGRHALRGATVRTEQIAIDAELLARLGIDSPLRGRAGATITIGPGASTAELVADVDDLYGPTLHAPVDAHITGRVDAKGMHAEAELRSPKVAITFTGSTPLTVESALAGRADQTPLSAKLTIPTLAARDLLGLFGRTDVTGGTFGGVVTVAGTATSPDVHAKFAANEIVIATTSITTKAPKLDKLEVEARWVNGDGRLEVSGFETGGRLLKITARGRPDSLETVRASVEAAKFDLRPVLAFAPGALGAARGILDAALTVRGLDPVKGDVRGRVHITEGRVPLAPQIGNLRRADLDVTFDKQRIRAKLDARLGAGSVKGRASAKLVGGLPSTAELEVELAKISPIGTVQPKIDATIAGAFTRTGTKWNGKLTIDRANVYVPPESGNELLDVGAPGDIIFVGAAPPPLRGRRKISRDPWLVADIDIRPTSVLVEDKDFVFAGVASGVLTLKLGNGMSLDGAISTERGDIDVLGRRYQLDHASIDFDGTLDPRLDIRLIKDFKTMTLTTDIVGRASDPSLRLSSDPPKYTQGELLAILGGAEPSDDSSGQLGQAVVSGGATVLSSRLSKRVTKYVPFLKIDTFNYEAATASSSRAVRFGKRINDRTYLIWRQRLEARPDENPGEAVLEVYLPWSLMLDTTAGSRGGGADLVWRKRW